MLKVYSFISSDVIPTRNIFVPSGLKAKPVTTGTSLFIFSGVPIDTGVTSFELAPSLTDRVASSLIVPVLLAATGALLSAAVITRM